jgi:hypothetical protein
MKRQSRSPAPRRRGFVAGRAARLCLVLVASTVSQAALACAGKATKSSAESASVAACRATHYVLSVHPGTIVSNENHELFARALRDSCGHQTAVRRASVRLLGYRATTGSRGRCTLSVNLQTGRYTLRLYVHGRRVAHASVSAIPVVAR